MTFQLPSLYVELGKPLLAAERQAYARLLSRLGRELRRPRAVVVFSAYWESALQQIGAALRPARLPASGDFAEQEPGPEDAGQLVYPARGDVALSLTLRRLLEQEGIACELDDRRGLDHGVWGPLAQLFPDADMPVAAMSVNPKRAPEEHYRIGQAIAELRSQGVLVVGSGGAMPGVRRGDDSAGLPSWALQFDEWLAEQLETWNLPALFDCERRAPREALPAAAQLAPLLLAMGAADAEQRSNRLHPGGKLGMIGQSCWMFGAEPDWAEWLEGELEADDESGESGEGS